MAKEDKPMQLTSPLSPWEGVTPLSSDPRSCDGKMFSPSHDLFRANCNSRESGAWKKDYQFFD